tara:strand:- start:44 stop:688 length:645 start_codon:yes stop_codon:yes gene_type:complete
MNINLLSIFFYKLISSLFIKIFFSKENQIYIRNYALPLNLIDKYYFLYPYYKIGLNEILSKKSRNILEDKSIIIYPKINKKKDYHMIKKTNICIIGNDILKVNLQLCKTSIKLSKKLKIKNIFFRKHPRSNFKITNFDKNRYLIKKDIRDLEQIELDSLILISFSSLLPYFLNNNFNTYICKSSLLLELKTQEKLESYLKIYKNAYHANQLIIL